MLCQYKLRLTQSSLLHMASFIVVGVASRQCGPTGIPEQSVHLRPKNND
jgi:hypothetical protein